MLNIKRVVLWELPPSFCALVQRAGRAARDFGTLGEAILIVSPSVLTKGITDIEVETALAEAETEAENRGEEELVLLENNGIQLVDEGGVRLAGDSEDEEEPEQKEEKKRRRKQTKKNFNSREAKYLSLYACTTQCRRIVWDEFFGNQMKRRPKLHNDEVTNLTVLKCSSPPKPRPIGPFPICDVVITANQGYLRLSRSLSRRV